MLRTRNHRCSTHPTTQNVHAQERRMGRRRLRQCQLARIPTLQQETQYQPRIPPVKIYAPMAANRTTKKSNRPLRTNQMPIMPERRRRDSRPHSTMHSPRSSTTTRRFSSRIRQNNDETQNATTNAQSHQNGTRTMVSRP